MTSSSLTWDDCFHGELSQLIWDTPNSHLLVPVSTVQISRTSALKWDFNMYFDGVQIFCVILSHEDRCFHCRRHTHSPNHKPFVNVLHCIFWRTVQHLSQPIIHSIHDWTGFKRKVRFCGGVRVHINIDDQLVRYGSPRHCSILRSLMS